jgi:hypothetical protein
MVWAVTRHATSRPGDPAPHDHVLVVNAVAMRDGRGGWKAPDTVLWRDHLHAATVVGRMASARRAVELGYAIEADAGQSGRLGHWRIVGVPREVERAFSKRADEITRALLERGHDSPQARGVAARATRQGKRFTPLADLMARWDGELEALGLSPAGLGAQIGAAGRDTPAVAGWCSGEERRGLARELLGDDGRLSERKVFTRADVIVAAGPLVYGRSPVELDRLVTHVLADREIVPLAVGGRERAFTTATVLRRERAIAELALSAAEERRGPAVTPAIVGEAIGEREALLGHSLTAGQRAAVVGLATSGRRFELVVGVAGAGKTTALAALGDAFRHAGIEVVGTSTSGQAAQTLGREAGIESRTLASLRWRLDHGQLRLHARQVLIVDEAGMTSDRDLHAVLHAAARRGTKVIVVGDDRQLGPVGAGGAFGALQREVPAAVHVLDENVRQHDVGERRALAELRAGSVTHALGWYREHGRIDVQPTRDEVLDRMVDRWAADALAGRESLMLAWQRVNVAELNTRARELWAQAGRLEGPELAIGGRRYAAGDRVVLLAPNPDQRLVTSQRATITAVDLMEGSVELVTAEGTRHRLVGDELAVGRLDHAYATTIHRAQGATADTAHHLHDGGGRELAYVALSRARQHSTVYLVADSPAQAHDDLQHAWSIEQRPEWLIHRLEPTLEDRDHRRHVGRAGVDVGIGVG